MKWRSVEEKSKIKGLYLCLERYEDGEFIMGSKHLSEGGWMSSPGFTMVAWLDLEIPEEFLKPKEPEKKPCPWCGQYDDWSIIKMYMNAHLLFRFKCSNIMCQGQGPIRETIKEAEAAIFERVK